jgi:SOS-response transcriptional repressor LexA
MRRPNRLTSVSFTGMTDELTDRQAEVLEVLREHYRRHGVPPTIRELAAVLGISPAPVYQHLGALVRKGEVKKVRRFYLPVERVQA